MHILVSIRPSRNDNLEIVLENLNKWTIKIFLESLRLDGKFVQTILSKIVVFNYYRWIGEFLPTTIKSKKVIKSITLLHEYHYVWNGVSSSERY